MNFGVDAGFGAHQIDHFSVLLGHVLLDLGQFCIVYDPEKREDFNNCFRSRSLFRSHFFRN
jgi:hypothetical protein